MQQGTGGGIRITLTGLFLLSSSSPVLTDVVAAHRRDERDELVERWSATAAGRQRDESRDEQLSRLVDTYARGTTTTTAAAAAAGDKTPWPPPYRDGARSIVTVARNGRSDGTPCPTVEGLWLSTNLETAFDMRATSLAGRLDVRAVGSDWTGGAESVFGDRGPVTAIVGQRDTGIAVTFVGHCRASHGVDTITGIWVIASPAKNKLDHHLAVQPIPDTLHRLQVE
ncbi:Uncharacterized protein FWK35_00026311 [Aphis craccivora]|uniref:Uncharacterized protein n=1 Tax=Aphis craccivora TaxID=307492 RepID=A0A6G0Z8L6_APHCR|nr:Uncharacterized protein FWK35_00026311 [Aphis craccivora]